MDFLDVDIESHRQVRASYLACTPWNAFKQSLGSYLTLLLPSTVLFAVCGSTHPRKYLAVQRREGSSQKKSG